MRPLVVFVLGLLGSGLAGARIVPKCALRDQLMKALTNLPEKAKNSGLVGENLVAKIVCYTEMASDFNTSLVTELTRGHESGESAESAESGERRGQRSREKRDTYAGIFSLAKEESLFSTIQPHTRGKQPGTQPPPRTLPTHHPHPMHNDEEEGPHSTAKPLARGRRHAIPSRLSHSGEDDDQICTLYGLFQFCGKLACSDVSDTTSSSNICGMDCNNLTDDDITDDVSCLLKILTSLVENGFSDPHWKELRREIRLIFQARCRDVQASEYFAEC